MKLSIQKLKGLHLDFAKSYGIPMSQMTTVCSVHF